LGNVSNYERIRQALDDLKGALAPYVEERLVEAFGEDSRSRYAVPEWTDKDFNIDVSVLANTIVNNWDEVFSKHLKREAKHVVHQVRKTRNRLAHQEAFDQSDTYTALHEVQRLLEAIGADAGSIVSSKEELVGEMAAAGESPEDVARKAEAAAEDALAKAASEPGYQARLVVLRSGLPTDVEFVFELPAVIGRADATSGALSVDLTDAEGGAYVSRRHAQIVAVDGVCILEDLGSANGTYIKRDDYEKIDRAEIEDGDRIAFGNAKFLFRVDR
jgi:hypothetical protein